MSGKMLASSLISNVFPGVNAKSLTKFTKSLICSLLNKSSEPADTLASGKTLLAASLLVTGVGLSSFRRASRSSRSSSVKTLESSAAVGLVVVSPVGLVVEFSARISSIASKNSASSPAVVVVSPVGGFRV